MNAKKRRFWTELLFVSVQTLVLVGITLIAVFPLSCRLTAEGIQIIGGDYAAPVLEEICVENDKTVVMRFSESVQMTDVVVSPKINGISDSDVHSENEELSPAIRAACGDFGKISAKVERSEDGKLFTFRFEKSTEIGKKYEIFGIVHDDIGNSLMFCVPFAGYNSNVPEVIMTEIQSRYTKASLKNGVVYRTEFVELLALTGGNLAGVELVSASDGETKKFVFPAIEVEQGQVFIVHLRTTGEGCVNETDNWNEATAEYSCEGILDLWSEDTTARFNDSADVIVLRNTVENCIMDGVMYAGEMDDEWKSGVMEMALELENCGIYESCEIENASSSKGMTPKKSLQRLDAQIIHDIVMSGGEVDFPVMVDSNSWEVLDTTPGVL